MVRTQIYLSENERSALQAMAQQTGKSQSELIRQAIDRFIGQSQKLDRKALLQQAKGVWRKREDLPDFSILRSELDRFVDKG